MGNVKERIENSIPSKHFVLVGKGCATAFETRKQSEDLYQGIFVLDVEYMKHGRRRQVSLFHKRVERMDTKRIKDIECPNSYFFHSGSRKVG